MNLARFAVPLVFAAFLISCGGGPSTGDCSAANCQGCCDSEGVCQLGAQPQACGASGMACVACPSGLTCQFGYCVSTGGGGGCTPKTCTQLGANCGQALDGCGGDLSCGTCEVQGESCGGGGKANVCGTGTCTPKTCAELGAECGQVSDGCGALLNCGTCTSPETCAGAGTANVCEVPSCTPKTCAQLGKNCGTVSDGCTGQLECGSCTVTGESCGGGGVDNVCGKGACVPKTCAELSKDCGAVDDGCGNALNCGTCTQPLTCGGGGVSNVCGATCPQGCPNGFTCSAQGVCEAAAPTSLVLNVVQAQKVSVSGSVKLNGGVPTQSCSSASPATIFFDHATASHYDASVDVPCNSGFTFSANLYPGTYKVSVRGTSYSNLPDWYVEVNPSLTVTSGQSGLVLNVVQAPQVSVSATIKLNGAAPTQSCSSASPATVFFDSAADQYDASINVPCNTGFAFTANVYPGTYKVSVRGTSYSNLPDWYVEVNPSLSVSAAQSGLIFNVVQAPTVSVSGSVKLNGAVPTQSCSSASPATIFFDHATASHYDTSVDVPCNTGFAFTANLYPGTYNVSVRGTSYSNLPDWYVEVNPSFAVSGAQSGVTLNVVQAPKVSVSGSIKFNGATPTQSCSSASPASVFFDSANSEYDAVVDVPCNSGFTFTANVYPGTYKVSVRGTSYSNLPDWYVEVNPSLSVSSSQSGLMFNVIQAPKVAVSGSVKLNGAVPTQSCSSASPATIFFDHATASHYDTSVDVACNSGFVFTANLYPGTYKVSVRGTSYSNLPGWYVEVKSSLTVSSAQSGVVLNVVQPPKVPVSGSIRLNGALPTLSCSSASPATVSFESTIDSNLDVAVDVPCDPSFGFTANLYPSTYRITVRGTSYSNLPDWYVTVVDRIKLPAGGTPIASSVVLSQVYGGGGNTGATYTNDFVELFNAGTTSVNLSGWSVQYASATGTTWQVAPLTGSIAPGRYYLVELGAGAGGTTALPAPDTTSTINLAATAGKIALVRNATALSVGCPAGADIADLVGFGGASCYEGSPAPAPSNTDALLRANAGCSDQADNGADFVVGAPAPRNTSSPAVVCN